MAPLATKDTAKANITGPEASIAQGRSNFGMPPDSGLSMQKSWRPGTEDRVSTVKVKQSDLILFTTQLSVMLDSGVVLSDALDAIAEQAEPGMYKMVIANVAEVVKGGENFSKALARYPKVFDSMFISIVKASEASGRMADMLNVLSGYLNFEAETCRRIKGALTYPFIMLLMAVAATATVMFFVLPRFMKIYETRGAALPKITQLLVSFSNLLTDFQKMTAVMSVFICLSIALYYWVGTLTGRKTVDFIKIRMPVMGTIFTDMLIARSMRIMATMVNSGVNLLDALGVMAGATENYHFKRLWADTDDRIRDGYQLSESILLSKGSKLIPPGITQMLRAGEKSGNLGNVCDKISIFYEKKLEASIKTATALIEPLMITILGGVIGTIAIALLLPVFRISSIIAH